MAEDERDPLPAEWRETVCPECGGELKFGEKIFSARSLQGWDEDGILHIGSDYEDFGESYEDEHLWCANCLKEWQLPESATFADLRDE